MGVLLIRYDMNGTDTEIQQQEQQIKYTTMNITSSAYQEGQAIPSKYTCDGGNNNPPLQFSEIPQNAQSLVLIMDDPDAPSGDFVHWTVWNINPGTTSIAENSVPQGAQEGTTDFGTVGYGGPCPPSGEHRYILNIYALDIILELPASARKQDILKAMNGHILGQGQLIGKYQRTR